MIVTTFDTYKNHHLPKPIEEAIEAAQTFIDSHSPNFPEDGKYQLNDEVFAMIMRYDTREDKDVPYETHEIMTDIQIVLEGEEYINTRTSEGLTPSTAKEDLQFYAEKPKEYARAYLTKGTFAVIYPQEAHAPYTQVSNVSKVLKMVVKVPFK